MSKNDSPLESVEQAQLIKWYDSWRKDKALFAIPNGTHLAGGGKQRAIQAGKLKAQGQRNGVPDLFLPIPSGGYHGLFIEMKRQKGGVVSDTQERKITMLNTNGYRTVVCAGFEAAKAEIEAYLAAR